MLKHSLLFSFAHCLSLCSPSHLCVLCGYVHSLAPLRGHASYHVPLIDRRSRWLIFPLAGILYFSEGLPFGIVTELAPLYLRLQHVPLATIGLLGAVGSAWTWKVFWSPLVELGTYRRWISGALAAMTILLASLAII